MYRKIKGEIKFCGVSDHNHITLRHKKYYYNHGKTTGFKFIFEHPFEIHYLKLYTHEINYLFIQLQNRYWVPVEK